MWDFGGLAGPYYQWTRKVNGKTMTRLLSAAQLVEHLFDPPGRWGTPSRFDRREMADAILFLARTGCQWRYLPDRYPPWPAVWQQWRRWRENGVWRRAMARLAALVRVQHGRHPIHSMVTIDAQTVKGGRAGPTFHNAGGRGGRTIGTKRSILVEILGLPIAARKRVKLDIKAPPKGTSGFVPLGPLYKVEHAFAQFGRWRRLSRCYEGTEASARAWLEVASVGYLFGRL